jgi:MSHA biogenesis protein MshE
LLEMSENMMNHLKASDIQGFSNAATKSAGYRSLPQSALTYAKMGVTSVEEVLKLVEMVAQDAPSSETTDHATSHHGATGQ